MREIQTTIEISAPLQKVWDILVNFDEWSDWNPTVSKAGGQADLDSFLDITMKGDNCEDMSYKPQIIELQQPYFLRWRATMVAGFIFTNDRVFELKEENGKTIFTNKECFSGLVMLLSWKKMNSFVLPILEKMNTALKDTAEKS
ncbi:MAG: SRPBCC family protein [Oligoflexales bacterium]